MSPVTLSRLTFLALMLGMVLAFPAPANAGTREDAIWRIHALNEFRDKALEKSLRLRVEDNLDSPTTVPAFRKFLSDLHQQLIRSHKGSEDSKARLNERLDEERTKYLNSIIKSSNEAQRSALIERCWAEKGRYVAKAGDADLEVVKVYSIGSRQKPQPDIYTVVMIAATNTTKTKILKPSNQIGLGAYGTSMVDSFGNQYRLWKISPKFLSDERPGIRPGETLVFKLRFVDEPLRNTKSIRISVKRGAYGQSKGATFDIPAEVFFCGMKNIKK